MLFFVGMKKLLLLITFWMITDALLTKINSAIRLKRVKRGINRLDDIGKNCFVRQIYGPFLTPIGRLQLCKKQIVCTEQIKSLTITCCCYYHFLKITRSRLYHFKYGRCRHTIELQKLNYRNTCWNRVE